MSYITTYCTLIILQKASIFIVNLKNKIRIKKCFFIYMYKRMNNKVLQINVTTALAVVNHIPPTAVCINLRTEKVVAVTFQTIIQTI